MVIGKMTGCTLRTNLGLGLILVANVCLFSDAFHTDAVPECQAVMDQWCMTSGVDSALVTSVQKGEIGSCLSALGNKGCNATQLYARYGLQGERD